MDQNGSIEGRSPFRAARRMTPLGRRQERRLCAAPAKCKQESIPSESKTALKLKARFCQFCPNCPMTSDDFQVLSSLQTIFDLSGASSRPKHWARHAAPLHAFGFPFASVPRSPQDALGVIPQAEGGRAATKADELPQPSGSVHLVSSADSGGRPDDLQGSTWFVSCVFLLKGLP